MEGRPLSGGRSRRLQSSDGRLVNVDDAIRDGRAGGAERGARAKRPRGRALCAALTAPPRASAFNVRAGTEGWAAAEAQQKDAIDRQEEPEGGVG